MNSILRTQVAVLALLAPLGAAIAQPAVVIDRGIVHVQATFGGGNAIVAQGPAIERFVLRQEGRIQPGEEVRYRLVGTPGGRAFLDVPGVLRNVAMAEARPGVYETVYVVRRDDNRDAFARATATLDKNGRRLSSKVSIVNDRDYAGGDGPRHRDDRAPQITDLTPSNGDRVRDRGRTEISAKVNDEGSGIDRATVVLRVDGRDVSRHVRFEGSEVRYADDLNNGRHVAELVVRDRAGNATRTSWSFDVVDRGRGRGHGDGLR